MANEIWNVAVDGAQLPGEHETVQVRELLTRHAGKEIRVWTPGMAGWVDPLTLPQFQGPAAVPMASSPPPSAAQPPRPVAAAASPSAASGPTAVSRGAGLPVSADQLQEQAGVFKALFDVSFNTLLTPKLIKAVYILVMAILGLTVAGLILMSLAGFKGGFVTGLVGLLVSLVVVPLVALLYLAMVRMGLEVIMAIFKIKEYAGVLADKARQSDSGRG
jgi:Domain of unknown function (DUF4282)